MDPARRWTAVLPVKGLASAKSRLGLPDASRLALAFLADALDAVAATPDVDEVIVATADPDVASVAVAHGARVVDDSEHPGINAAAAHGARSRLGDGGVVVLVSDLPCLTASALGAALALASRHDTAFLPDLAETGTTMWFGREGDVATAFGPDSRAVHAGLGAVDLAAHYPDRREALAPARCDVDTEEALAEAVALGLGPATGDALRA